MLKFVHIPLEDDDWDRQMREDFEAGKLDSFIEAARQDYRAGRTTEF